MATGAVGSGTYNWTSLRSYVGVGFRFGEVMRCIIVNSADVSQAKVATITFDSSDHGKATSDTNFRYVYGAYEQM